MTVTTLKQPPFTATEIEAAIAEIPRLHFAKLPTPLDDCPRLSTHLGGPRILIKRDDLTGLAFGGNKTRNLDFRMAEAQAEGADVMIANLEAQSNSARQTTAAANQLGMKTVLVLPKNQFKGFEGNLLVDRLLGAEIHFVDAEDQDGVHRELEKIADELRGAGHKPYSLRDGRMFEIGVGLAYILCLLEIEEQLQAHAEKIDRIYLSSGSKTQAGLILGGRALGKEFEVAGVTAWHAPDRHAKTAEIVNRTAELLNWDIAISPEEVVNYDEFAGEELGSQPEKCIEAVQLVAQTEGIILGPQYSGKAMACLIEHIRQGKIDADETVVFVHTGGTPEIFAFKELFLA